MSRARDPVACREFLFAARAGAQTHAEWLACTNLLLAAAPTSIAPQLVREVRLRLWQVPRWDVARAPAVREPEVITARDELLEVPPGYPPGRALMAVPGPRPRARCLSSGPQDVAWLRYSGNNYAGHRVTAWPRKAGQEFDRDVYRLHCLALLAEREFESLGFTALNCLGDDVLEAAGTEGVLRERERIGRQWHRLVDGLVVTVRDGDLASSRPPALAQAAAAATSLIALPGLFPRAGSYTLHAGPPPAEAFARITGPEELFVVRTSGAVGAQGAALTEGGTPFDRDDYRVRCLLQLAGATPAELPLRGETAIDHLWRDARHYRKQVDQAVAALGTRWRQLQDRLKTARFVAPDAPDQPLPVIVEVLDRRGDQAAAIPSR